MSEPKFTPGPWRVSGEPGCRMVAINWKHDGEQVIADIWGNGERHEANAALIAAAPDLYAELDRSTDLLEDALKRLPQGCGLYRCIEDQIAENNKVLGKARGENG